MEAGDGLQSSRKSYLSSSPALYAGWRSREKQARKASFRVFSFVLQKTLAAVNSLLVQWINRNRFWLVDTKSCIFLCIDMNYECTIVPVPGTVQEPFLSGVVQRSPVLYR